MCNRPNRSRRWITGLIFNCILCRIINEASTALQEGIDKEAIHTLMRLESTIHRPHARRPGRPGCRALRHAGAARDLGEDKYHPCPLLWKMVDAGLPWVEKWARFLFLHLNSAHASPLAQLSRGYFPGQFASGRYILAATFGDRMIGSIALHVICYYLRKRMELA